jgi:hypothetical protein
VEVGRKKSSDQKEFVLQDAMIIGGGWHALGCGAALKESGVNSFVILEQSEGVHLIFFFLRKKFRKSTGLFHVLFF